MTTDKGCWTRAAHRDSQLGALCSSTKTSINIHGPATQPTDPEHRLTTLPSVVDGRGP
jgi:hypothetical protein